MFAQNITAAAVSNIVYDLMNVEIIHSSLFNNIFEYRICCDDEKIIRKGRFTGPNVQLRLSFIKEGKYSFLLFLNGEQIQQSGFEKIADLSYNFSH